MKKTLHRALTGAPPPDLDLNLILADYHASQPSRDVEVQEPEPQPAPQKRDRSKYWADRYARRKSRLAFLETKVAELEEIKELYEQLLSRLCSCSGCGSADETRLLINAGYCRIYRTIPL